MQHPQKQTRSKSRRWKIAGIILVLILLSLTFWPQLLHEKIESLTREQIEQRIDADVTFSHLYVSQWQKFPSLTFSLRDLVIITRGEDRDTLLAAQEIAASINAWRLVTKGGIDITSLAFTKPRIVAHVERDGTTNFSIFKSSPDSASSSAAPISLQLDEITIDDAHIHYADEVAGTTFVTQEFSFNGKGDLSSTLFDMRAEVKTESATLTLEKRPYFENKKIDLSLLLSVDKVNRSLKVTGSKVTVNGFAFMLDGTFGAREDRYDVDATFSSPRTSLHEILSLANFFHENFEDLQSEGTVRFGGFVKGSYVPRTDTIPTFNLSLEVKEGSISLASVDESIKDIHFDFALSNDKGLIDSTEIQIDSIFFRMDEHVVQGHAHVHHLVNSDIDARLSGSIHAEEVLEVFPVKGLKAKGELKFDVSVDGRYSALKWPAEIPEVHFDVDMARGMLKYDSLPDSLSAISFHTLGHVPQGNWQNSRLEIAYINMNVGDNPVTGNIVLEDLARPKVKGKLETSIHLQDVLAAFPVPGLDMKGSLEARVDIDGTLAPREKIFPKMTASLSLLNGYYKTSAYPEPLENVQIKAALINKTSSLDSTRLVIEELTYTLEGEPFELRGLIKNFSDFEYDLSAKGTIDLGKMSKVLALSELSLSGKIHSDIQVRGRLADLESNRYERTKASGDISLERIRIAGKGLARPIHIPSASFKLTPQLIELSSMRVRTGHTSFTLSGELHDYFCLFTRDNDKVLAKLKLDADTLDLNQWKSAFTTVEPDSPSLAAGTSLKKSAWQVPAFMDFDFDSNIKTLRYEDMKISDMEGEILMKDGVLSIRESGFNSLNANFQASGTYDSRNIDKPLFDFRLKIDELDIQKAYKEIKLVRELLPAAANAEGLFSIDYSIKGELEPSMQPRTASLTGMGDMHIANAKINGMKMFDQLSKQAKKRELNDPHLRDFTISSEIKDSKIYVKPFRLNVSGFNTEIEGMNEISGKIDYLIKVQLLPLNLVKVPFHVTGTYDNPKVSLGKG